MANPEVKIITPQNPHFKEVLENLYLTYKMFHNTLPEKEEKKTPQQLLMH
ncbi:MAG: hypothetical protein N3G22_00350 [Candidatus Micrarchaeota archaeon]|nr:hypothetical protein [Candidatus Micrarchaeota archaeon]